MLKPFPFPTYPHFLLHFSLHYLFIDFKQEQFFKLDRTAHSAVRLAGEVRRRFRGEPKWGHCNMGAYSERAEGQMGLLPALF